MLKGGGKGREKTINLEGKGNDEFSLLGLDERKRGKNNEFLVFDYSRKEKEKKNALLVIWLVYTLFNCILW